MVAIPVVTVERVNFMARNDRESGLTIHYQAQGVTHAIHFPRNVLADLIVGLAGMQTPKSGQRLDIPAIYAEGAQAFYHSQKDAGLGFHLKGGWTIPILIDKTGIEPLRQKLAELELLLTQAGSAAH